MKVIVIGIDGGTFDLILPWVRRGHLPNFKNLIEKGSWSSLDCGHLPCTAIGWNSFMTGYNLGKHGINDFYMIEKDGKKNIPIHVSAHHRQNPSLWSIISRQKKRVAVFNVPMTYPPEEVNGILVSGFQTPPNSSNFTYPLSIKEKLDELSGGYSIYAQGVSPETNLHNYLSAAHQVTDKQIKAIDYFLQKGDWDFFMYVFQQSDLLQHYYWHFIDENNPQYREDETFRGAILGIYKKIDDYLGTILENLDDNTALIVMSDHGAGPVYNRFWLNNWLMKEGYLKLKNNFDGLFKKSSLLLDICEADFFNFFLKDSFIGKMRTLVTGKKVERKNRFFYKFKHIDWSKTKAYCIAHNQLSINLKGREPEGIVNPGEEFEDLRNELIRKLKEIISPVTGKALITEIYKKEQIFRGKFIEALPDIVYICDDYRTSSQGGYKIGSSKVMDNPFPRSGDHRREGVVIIYGKLIKKKYKIEKAKLIDLAPTILSLLGLRIPKDMDGKIIKSCFVNPQDVYEEYSEYQIKEKKSRQDFYSKEEIEQIEEKLRSLGYLG